ncbi:MAG: hypothetical protein NDI90_03445 [Nitrospira sp. BO4]|jgi:hypothetical protein|nr:hypothetical protein [Nitrospira sp. BO4]
MADDPNPLNKILDALAEILADAWAFIKYPMETTAATTAWAYWKTMLASMVKMFPALALFMNGQTTIAPEAVRKPDEHLQSQAQATATTLEGSNLFNVSSANGTVFVSVSDVVPVSDWEFAVIYPKAEATIHLADHATVSGWKSPVTVDKNQIISVTEGW